MAHQIKDKKSDYFATVYSVLQERLGKAIEQFRSYVLSLLGDREYDKIVESIAKSIMCDKDLALIIFISTYHTSSFPPSPNKAILPPFSLAICPQPQLSLPIISPSIFIIPLVAIGAIWALEVGTSLSVLLVEQGVHYAHNCAKAKAME